MPSIQGTVFSTLDALRGLVLDEGMTLPELIQQLSEMQVDLPIASLTGERGEETSEEIEEPRDIVQELNERIGVLEDDSNRRVTLGLDSEYGEDESPLFFGSVTAPPAPAAGPNPEDFIQAEKLGEGIEDEGDLGVDVLVPTIGRRQRPWVEAGQKVLFRLDERNNFVALGNYHLTEPIKWMQAIANWTNAFGNNSYVDCIPAPHRDGTGGGLLGTQNDPPGAPTVGDVYQVGAEPTGAWIGRTGYLAMWTDDFGSGRWDWTWPSVTGAVRVYLPRGNPVRGAGSFGPRADPNVQEHDVIGVAWLPTDTSHADPGTDRPEAPVCVTDYLDAPLGTVWAFDYEDDGSPPTAWPGWTLMTATDGQFLVWVDANHLWTGAASGTGARTHGAGTNDHDAHTTTDIQDTGSGLSVVTSVTHSETDNEPEWYAMYAMKRTS